MEELRIQLDLLVDKLSSLADSKRMYGSVPPQARPSPALSPQLTGSAENGAGSPGSAARGSTSSGTKEDSNGDATSAATCRKGTPAEPLPQAPPGLPAPPQQAYVDIRAQAEAADSAVDVEELLRQADECGSRMLSLLDDQPYAATSHQPLRGAALLAAALSAFLRGGGASEAALSGLQAAVKLQPLNPTAWNCLAHSYWERGDLSMAASCLSAGLRHCPSVAAHQMMSLLVRQQEGFSGASLLQAPTAPAQQQPQPLTQMPAKPHGTGAVAAQAAPAAATGVGGSGTGLGHATAAGGGVTGSGVSAAARSLPSALSASLSHARRALEMDLENGYSWYVLAMAQMAAYFRGDHSPPGSGSGSGCGTGGPQGGSGGRGPRGDLQRVLAAFAQAERFGCVDLPDLYYNRGALNAFTQDFGAALQDYSRAALLDPGLPAVAQRESLLVLLGQLAGLVAGRGGVRERHWAAVTALLAADAARGSELLPRTHLERLTLKSLQELFPGSNRGAVVLCRPLVFVSPPLNASGALYLVCVDTGGCVFVLALTHIHHDAFDMTQLLAVVHPELRRVDVTWPPPTPLQPLTPPAASRPCGISTTGSTAAATIDKPDTTTSDNAGHPVLSASPTTAAAAAATFSAAGGAPLAAAEDPSRGAAATHSAAPGQPAAAVAGAGTDAAVSVDSPGPAAPPSRSFRFPLLLVGCDPGCRSYVLVDGVPLHQAPQTPVLHHVMRAA